MKLKYKAPANGGSLVFCPHCGKKLERYKETTVKYCLECQRGFAIYGGASTEANEEIGLEILGQREYTPHSILRWVRLYLIEDRDFCLPGV